MAIIILAIYLILGGLAGLGAISISAHLLFWLMLISGILLLVEVVHPITLPAVRRRTD